MEIIPIIDPKSLNIIRYENRKIVREKNLWHYSSLILPIQKGTGKILVQTRPTGKTFAGKSDIFGGFVNKCQLSEKLRLKFSSNTLEQLLLETAVREANEELKLSVNDKITIVNKDKLEILRPSAGFIANNSINKEISSVYILMIPLNANVITFDDVQGEIVEIKSSFVDFNSLKIVFKNNPDAFADSLLRVMTEYFRNPKTKLQIDIALRV